MKTVLLIDDDARLRLAFSEALRLHGYRVLEAASGSEGLELARQQLPDLILTDINMPGGGGHELLKDIRQDAELNPKQVVLMTGDPGLVTLRRGMEMGADDFLLKPVTLERLVRCVEGRLARAQTHWRVEDRMLTRLRSSLHSTLPHEFFTPLAGIVGLAGILRADHKNLSTEEVQEIHDDLYYSGLRLHRTLRNYLEILELQDEKMPDPALVPTLDPKAIEQGVLKGIGATIERSRRGPDVTTQLAPCAIRARGSDVALIVEELVDNGCKFSRLGSPVTVALGTDGVLTVTDAGRGMSPEEIAQVGAFQQFNRKTREQQGLGLGLILVKKLAAKNGAQFSMESPVGDNGGTRVRVAFQLAEPATAAA